MLCWCAEVAKATAMPSGDAIPQMDGYGGEDSAEERGGETAVRGVVRSL